MEPNDQTRNSVGEQKKMRVKALKVVVVLRRWCKIVLDFYAPYLMIVGGNFARQRLRNIFQMLDKSDDYCCRFGNSKRCLEVAIKIRSAARRILFRGGT